MLNDRVELTAAGSKGSDNRNLYIYGDHLGSAVLALDGNQKEAMRLGYSPFGQVYRKTNNTKFWKLNSGVNANNQLNQLMPYQYTGRYTEGATGYTNLDARWYNPYTQRFNQPDYWSFNNTGLPKAVQHELMRFTGLNTAQLLRDPAQQMRYGYVSSNPLTLVDLSGLETTAVTANWNVGWGTGLTGGFNLVSDDEGNINLQVVWGAGGDTPGASLTLGAEFTNADNIDQLTGEGSQAGVDIGLGLAGESGVMFGEGYSGTYTTFGFSAGIPVGNSGYVTNTSNVFNGFNIFDDVLNPAAEFIGGLFGDC